MEKSTKELDNILTEEFLRKNYPQISYDNIGKMIGCDGQTVRKRLIKFNIPIKEFNYSKILTKEYLIQNYGELNQSEIAKIVGCDINAVNSYLKKYNISIRSSGEIRKGKPNLKLRKPHSKKHCENMSRVTKGKPKPEGFGKKLSKITKGKPHTFKDKEKHTQNILKTICACPNLNEIRGMKYLNKLYPEKFKFCGDGSCSAGRKSADAYSEELNTAVLFHGVYWHCKPGIYKADFFHPQIKKTAQEIWNYDTKVKTNLEKLGYKVIILWEDELLKEE